jgi:hypothetical protein
MRANLLSLACCSVLFVSGAAFAQNQGATVQPAVDTNMSSNNTLICRPSYHEGTIIRKPVCHTKREWNYIRFLNQDEVRLMEARGTLQHGR